jgi:uncharacterized membrane protein YccF (DUF307 family)
MLDPTSIHEHLQVVDDLTHPAGPASLTANSREPTGSVAYADAMIRLILNILWFIFGGWLSGLLWLFGGAILALTIVGLPWTFAAWRIASYSFWPFGREVVWRDTFSGAGDIGTGPVGVVLNVIWFVFAGWYIALSHLLIAVAEFISIIGIPFALKDLELAKLALAPVGRTIRTKL